MSVPTFLQNKPYKTNTASTSHALTLNSAVRSRGGLIGPSTLVATLSYDGTSGDQCSGISDTDGNTWQKGTAASNGVGTNGEMWFAYNAKGGNAPTITVSMSSSVKMTMMVVETDQIRPVSPLDQALARIDTTNSTARTSAASNSTKRTGMLAVVIGGIAWSHVSLTCSNGGSGFSGTVVTDKESTSGYGVAMARRTADLANITGSNSIGRFTMSASGTTPCATMSLAFLRDGVVTSTAEDGWINDIEGSVGIGATDTSGMLFTSSTSAPGGGTGGSEKDQCYSFFSDFSANILSGCTLGSTFTYNYSSQGGFDDGTGYENAFLYAYKSGELGSTLDGADEFPGGGVQYSLGVDPVNPGIRTVTLTTSTSYNTSGVTATRMAFEGDTGGGFSGTWAQINFYEGNVPAYLQLTLYYPQDTAIPSKALTITKYAPGATVTQNHKAAIPLKTLAITKNIPTAGTTNKHKVAMPLSSLAMSAKIPGATTTNKHKSAVPLKSLASTGHAPLIAVTQNNFSAIQKSASATIATGWFEGRNFSATTLTDWQNCTPGGLCTDVVLCLCPVFSGVTISQVTYGGVACSLVNRTLKNSPAKYEEIWTIHNPPQGTQMIQIQISSGSGRVQGYVIPFNSSGGIGVSKITVTPLTSSGAKHFTDSIVPTSAASLIVSYANWEIFNTGGSWSSDDTLINAVQTDGIGIAYQSPGGSGTMGWSTANSWPSGDYTQRTWEMLPGAGADQLSMTGLAGGAAVTENNKIALPKASLSVTGQVPGAATSNKHKSALGLMQLSLTPRALNSTVINNHRIALSLATLTLLKNTPTASQTFVQRSLIGGASLTVSRFAPSATTTMRHKAVLPSLNLTLSGKIFSSIATVKNWTNLPQAVIAIIGHTLKSRTNSAIVKPPHFFFASVKRGSGTIEGQEISQLDSAIKTLVVGEPLIASDSPSGVVPLEPSEVIIRETEAVIGLQFENTIEKRPKIGETVVPGAEILTVVQRAITSDRLGGNSALGETGDE